MKQKEKLPAFKVVIPARHASRRLPGKPLLDLGGKPMIQRVHEACLAAGAAEVLVATDDRRVAEAVQAFGGHACMTRPEHESGTDRVAEVAAQLGWADDDLVVNVQGDEPLMPPAVIAQVARLAAPGNAGFATLCAPIESARELHEPSVVKLVMDRRGRALYFSRAPLPWCRDEFAENATRLPEQVAFHRHLGIYAYRVAVLKSFVAWDQAMLEAAEKLEQLRALYQGLTIRVARAERPVPAGVDTEEDLRRVRALLDLQPSPS